MHGMPHFEGRHVNRLPEENEHLAVNVQASMRPEISQPHRRTAQMKGPELILVARGPDAEIPSDGTLNPGLFQQLTNSRFGRGLARLDRAFDQLTSTQWMSEGHDRKRGTTAANHDRTGFTRLHRDHVLAALHRVAACIRLPR